MRFSLTPSDCQYHHCFEAVVKQGFVPVSLKWNMQNGMRHQMRRFVGVELALLRAYAVMPLAPGS